MRRLVLLSCVLLIAATAFAQPAPAQAKYTWIRYVHVDAGREADFLKYIASFTKPMMEDLMRDGTVVAWGVATPITHGDEQWTHVVYVGMKDWSTAEAIGRRLDSMGAMPAADQKRMWELASSIREGSTRDVIIRHLVQSDAPPMSQPKYINADTYVLKAGRDADAVALFNDWAKPLFTASQKMKTYVPIWGFSSRELGPEPWTHMVWMFMSDLAARDEMDAVQGMLDQRKLQGYMIRLNDMTDVTKQQSQILRIITP
jgi:hypothetical protein